ncbi:hypothetical protein [Qipengyuania sphaerica]|uniref:hypothetical protein n=1 Tax=Qipengyuania sphaerica TaxID=2867243 RepID=UPI001C869700|nr:hypothetical protein [Qipengyuania sphaerica]MBX7540910.1 hypothetical protein [Qipengyuania sphaerica]
MSRGLFWTLIVLLTLFMLVCASELGVLLGAFVAIIGAILFIAPIMLLDRDGVIDVSTWPEMWPMILAVFIVGMFAMIALFAAYSAWGMLEGGEQRKARARFALSYAIFAIPAGLALSLKSLTDYF